MARKRKLVEVKCLALYWGRSVGSCSSAHSAPTGRTLGLLYPLPAKFGSGPCDQCDLHPWGSGSHLTPHTQSPSAPARLTIASAAAAATACLPAPAPLPCVASVPAVQEEAAGRGGRAGQGGGDFSERCLTRANRKRQ